MSDFLPWFLLLSFPADYPDTQAGQAYWEARAFDLESEQAKKPKSKRFNYEKRGVASPFRPRWGLLFDGQNAEGDVEDESAQVPCVLRGESYMEPFLLLQRKPPRPRMTRQCLRQHLRVMRSSQYRCLLLSALLSSCRGEATLM